jgi:hypothetical protein
MIVFHISPDSPFWSSGRTRNVKDHVEILWRDYHFRLSIGRFRQNRFITQGVGKCFIPRDNNIFQIGEVAADRAKTFYIFRIGDNRPCSAIPQLVGQFVGLQIAVERTNDESAFGGGDKRLGKLETVVQKEAEAVSFF